MHAADATLPVPYHKGRASRPDGIPASQRKFVAWDGEGITFRANRPQSYVLFGCSTGEYVMSENLTTHELCAFIVATGREHPDAIHVGFAFTYDANMIVRSLLPRNLRYLHERGHVTIGAKHGKRYCIQMRRGKWFSVTEYGEKYDRVKNPHDKYTVRIFDVFGFFTCSFIKAYEDLIGPVPEEITRGKANRSQFSWDEREEMQRYWEIEVRMMAQLAEELRERMYRAGLRITSWHGPGALASYAMKTHGVKQHMSTAPDAVREAARYAYAGGRFELFKAGRVEGPIYSLDINSAYPFAIAQLPSLTEGEWVHVQNPSRIARFGVYHVRLTRPSALVSKTPGPLFHRDAQGNISFPWNLEGWYWSPEVARLHGSKNVEITEGWEYLGAHTEPFAWVRDMYATRRAWKAGGNPAQLALKLCLNSLYGKMAQRVGYDPHTGRIPPWHQLEWAGWVTSYTRSMLYGVLGRIPWRDVIAVETDGIYTTASPDSLGITHSTELGGWEVGTYDELMYVQSGLAWLRQGPEWTSKRRGLDASTWTLDKCAEYVRTLGAGERWAPFVGQQTRFITLGAALMSSAPMKLRHCLWETTERALSPGEIGKRVHTVEKCAACRKGLSAWDMPHDLVVRTDYRNRQTGEIELHSYPHDIPWENTDHSMSAEWREFAEAMT